MESDDGHPRFMVSMRVKASLLSLCFIMSVGFVAYSNIPNIAEAIGWQGTPPEDVGEPEEQIEHLGLEVEWIFNESAWVPEEPGQGEWIYDWGSYQNGFTVWDIDDDGESEVIFCTYRDIQRIWCISRDGDLEWAYPPIDWSNPPYSQSDHEWQFISKYSRSKVSLVDVTNDGTYELAVFFGSELRVLESDGSLLWRFGREYTTYPKDVQLSNPTGAPQALDVDRDGDIEFFVADSDRIICIDHKGRSVWSEHGGPQPTIADIDQDGSFEVLAHSRDFHLYCLSAVSGTEKWSFDTISGLRNNQPDEELWRAHSARSAWTENPVIVADINNDGSYEAITWSYYSPGTVFVISSQGTEIGRWIHPREGGFINLCQAMGDVDNDGTLDLVIMTYRQDIEVTPDSAFAISLGGSNPRTIWELDFSRWSEEGRIPQGATSYFSVLDWDEYQCLSFQLIADIDGDDEQEILWLVPFPVVTDAATGRLEGYYANDISKDIHRNGAWWGDVDRDGVSEWIVQLKGGTGHDSSRDAPAQTMKYCLTMGGKFPAKAYWPGYYHSAYPGQYQAQQDWLLLKAAYSNGLWFPIPQTLLQ